VLDQKITSGKFVSFRTTPGLVFVEHCRAVQRLLDPDATAELARQLDETQQILTDSVAKVLDRSTELDSISSKSKDLLSKSGKFRAETTNLKWMMQ
jgi:exonuclease I